MGRSLSATAAAVLLAGCTNMIPQAPPADSGHLRADSTTPAAEIPEVVEQTPFLPPPEEVPDTETYTVVVNDVPVKELLFALARDADVNIDIDSGISGKVTLNAVDQTLAQILDRLSRQVDMRYEIKNGTLVISADTPYLKTYDVGYVNLSRDTQSVNNVTTRVATTGEGAAQGVGGAGGGSGGSSNSSTTKLNTQSYNRFWETLTFNILAILGETPRGGGDQLSSDSVIVNPEAGLINVRATHRQHELIQAFIDNVLNNARRQVLIEATIVEVTLNDQYQAGVDWNAVVDIGDGSSFNLNQGLLGGITEGIIDQNISSFVGGYDYKGNKDSVTATVRALREFGDTKVLSSPRLMVLNNQTAVLKVVQELIYFTIEVTDKDSTATSQGRTIIESEVNSVPVGLVMAVTPQISANDEVTLTVRPTISQQVGEAIDPATQIIAAERGTDLGDIVSTVPVIRTREMESILKLTNGQVAVLGGLMQDEVSTGKREVPGLAKVPLLGELFFDTDEYVSRKTELVIFLRPVVVRQASLEGDLRAYRTYLEGNGN